MVLSPMVQEPSCVLKVIMIFLDTLVEEIEVAFPWQTEIFLAESLLITEMMTFAPLFQDNMEVILI